MRLLIKKYLFNALFLALLLALLFPKISSARIVSVINHPPVNNQMPGSGIEADPYIIQDVNDLQNVNLDPDAWYELGNDIDASATSGWDGGKGFLPLGPRPTLLYPSYTDWLGFTGHFDGKGYKISDLYISRASDTAPFNYCIGLFDIISHGAVVQNLTLEDPNITGYKKVGGISGVINYYGALAGSYRIRWGDTGASGNTAINNCHIIGGSITGQTIDGTGGICGGGSSGSSGYTSVNDCTVTGTTITGDSITGGIIGFMGDPADAVLGCSCNNTTVIGTSDTGGIIGSAYCIVEDCWFVGSVSGTIDVGGIAGGAWDETIEECWSSGTVEASSATGYVGGIAGYLYTYCAITNCYSRSDVTGLAANGGGIGKLDGGTITNSYSTGTVSNTATYGGFIGVAASGTATECFWDTETSGVDISAGLVVGHTTEWMKDKDNFIDAGWDFSTPIWGIKASENDGYPYFGPSEELPTVETLAATSINYGGAILSGNLTSLGTFASCNVYFQYGTTVSYSNNTTSENKDSTGTFTFELTGLLPSTLYHFRSAIEDPEVFGEDSTFTTEEAGIDIPLDPYAPTIGDPNVPVTGWIKPLPYLSSWFGGCSKVDELPFYDTFNEQATGMGMNVCMLYFMMMMATVSAMGLGVLLFTGSVILTLGTMIFTLAAAVGTTVAPGYLVFVLIILGLGIYYISKQH